MVLWLSFLCSTQPVKNESRHVLRLLAVQEVARASNEVKAIFTVVSSKIAEIGVDQRPSLE